MRITLRGTLETIAVASVIAILVHLDMRVIGSLTQLGMTRSEEIEQMKRDVEALIQEALNGQRERASLERKVEAVEKKPIPPPVVVKVVPAAPSSPAPSPTAAQRRGGLLPYLKGQEK